MKCFQVKPNFYFDGLPREYLYISVCIWYEDSFTQMKWSNAHEVTLRAVLDVFMYLCPHLVRRQTLISPQASHALLYE